MRERCQEAIECALAYLASKGYQVKVSRSLTDIARFWQDNDGVEGLYRFNSFNGKFHADNSAEGIFLEHDGRLIGTVWNRLIPLRDNRLGKSMTLRQALEGLYIWYSDPGDAPRREQCTVNCEIAEMIRHGTISWRGAYFIHPDHQGQGLSKPLSLLSRVLSITAPTTFDWLALLTDDKNKDRMLDLFPCSGFWRGVKHNGLDYWLCLSSFEETVHRTLKSAD